MHTHTYIPFVLRGPPGFVNIPVAKVELSSCCACLEPTCSDTLPRTSSQALGHGKVPKLHIRILLPRELYAMGCQSLMHAAGACLEQRRGRAMVHFDVLCTFMDHLLPTIVVGGSMRQVERHNHDLEKTFEATLAQSQHHVPVASMAPVWAQIYIQAEFALCSVVAAHPI